MGDFPSGFDVSVASPARIYDALLGGKDNFEADRRVVEELVRLSPVAKVGTRDNRDFLGRAVRFLLRKEGISRFLDIGSGLPTQENVHQVAHKVDPAAQVVYVDNDPMAVVHASALLDRAVPVTAIQADLRDPEDLLDRPEVRRLLRPREPVGLLLVAVLHFITDDERPYDKVRALCDAMPRGSLLVISHACDDADRERAAEATRAYKASSALRFRSRADIGRFFEGTELVEPGLAWAFDWRPIEPVIDPEPLRKGFLAGVAHIL